MGSLNQQIQVYKKQLDQGDIRKAYQGIIGYMMKLRNYFARKYPEYRLAGSIYQGYMDMTFFSLTNEYLREKKLKIAIVFLHESLQFEVWLSANNKIIQKKYWNIFQSKDWTYYSISSMEKGVDSILSYVLTANPDFDDLDSLTEEIESGTFQFIEDVQNFLEINKFD
ncbi:hypothetical protein SANA_14530 [Gottschalkiaceae bacterium SANA]|nr:hypothetical protein SANA_14530 [Gottschalkiaceae bacterium SANA]